MDGIRMEWNKPRRQDFLRPNRVILFERRRGCRIASTILILIPRLCLPRAPFSFLTLSFSFWDSLFSLSTNSVREPVNHATCGFRDGRSAWDMSAMSPYPGEGPKQGKNRASKWAYKKKCLKLSKWATTFNMNDFLEAGYAATPPLWKRATQLIRLITCQNNR